MSREGVEPEGMTGGALSARLAPINPTRTPAPGAPTRHRLGLLSELSSRSTHQACQPSSRPCR